jgi:biopolymer transport protein ExbD
VQQPRPDRPVFVTLKSDRSLAIGDVPVAREAVEAALDAASGHDHEQRLFLRADGSVSYSEVMAVMNLLRAAGYAKVALVALESRQGT